MFMSRLLPGGHLTSGRIPDRGQHGTLPVPPLIVAPSGATMWGSAPTPPSGSGSVISGPPHPPPPLVPIPAHPSDNDIDDANKQRLSFPVPPQAGLYISDLLYRGGGIWSVRRGAASPGTAAARAPGEEQEERRTSAPSSPLSKRREGGDDGGSGGGNMTSSTTGTNSHKLKFGIDRILAKEPTKPAKSPQPLEDPIAPCLCGVPPCSQSRLGTGGGPASCTPTTSYLLPTTHSHLHRGLHSNHTSSSVLDLHPLHHHQHHQHPGQHHSHHHHHHHRPRPQHHQHHQQQHHHGGPYLYRAADFPGPYSVLACDGNPAHSPNNSQQSPHQTGTGSAGKRKRSWSRAVFSHLQRKGLEKRFEVQKYVTKPDRRQLAGLLNLTDAQVKVWFQNRRMKWRHAEEAKRKRDESQQNQEHLRQNSENRAKERGEESSDSDIEVTDSPNGL